MNGDSILRELRGLRLALYDEALSAGPRGLTAPELRAATIEEAQRMGLRPEAHAEAVRWLLEHRLLDEYQAGRYRARAKEAALAQQDDAPAPTSGPPTPEPAPSKPVVAQLRTPVFTPRQRRDGQTTFF